MGDLFKAVSGGLARFVFAWLMPSFIALGLFVLYVLPDVQTLAAVQPIVQPAASSGITAALIFAFLVLTLSVLFAYASLPIYQLLEGYTLPGPLRRAGARRHRGKYTRLQALQRRYETTGVLPPGLDFDQLRAYPHDLASVRATRLGNALTAMESWSRNRYHLDSQTMWFELLGVSSDNVRRDTEEGRAPVDFFVSAIAHAVLLAASSWTVAALRQSPQAAAVGALAAVTIPVSYHLAVKNVLDWNQSVKAMVNLGRRDLAEKMGLRWGATLKHEQDMWSSHHYAIELNQTRHVPAYNYYRLPPPPPPPP